MNNYHPLPQLIELDQLQKFISEETKIRKDSHGMTHMEARESILEQLGWETGYAYSKWRKEELKKANRLVEDPKRQACIINREPDQDASVYIFQISASICFTDEDDIEYCYKDVSNTLQDEDAHHMVLSHSLQIIKPHAICNIWISKGPFDPGDGVEWRKPDCSCKKNHTYKMREFYDDYKESYFLSTTEELVDWATKWGGVACFEKELLDSLKDDHPLKKGLTAPYLRWR